jgi:hypothetical protein
MLAVKGIYDGKVAVPDQPVSVMGRQEVIITFLEPVVHRQERKEILNSLAGLVPDNVDEDAIKAERLAIANSLFGILPSTVSDDEIRTERLKRYESNT